VSVSKRRFIPHTRQFNERLIEKKYETWGMGLIKDLYSPPNNGFDILVNAIDRKYEIVGRPGSILYDFVDYPIFYPANWRDETFSESVIGGAIYDASNEFKGRSPKDGDIFILYDGKDFSDNVLNNAKERYYLIDVPLLAKWDVFKITDNLSNVEYYGNLLLPQYRSFYSTQDRNISISANSGVLTVSGHTENLDLNIGNFVKIGERLYYIDNVSGDTMTVNGDVEDGVYDNCSFHAPVYSSFYYENENYVLIHSGDALYWTDIPYNGWRRIPVVSEERLSESNSVFNQIGSDVVFSTLSGHYKIVIRDRNLIAYKINHSLPTVKAELSKFKIFGFADSEYELPDGTYADVVGYEGWNDDLQDYFYGGVLVNE